MSLNWNAHTNNTVYTDQAILVIGFQHAKVHQYCGTQRLLGFDPRVLNVYLKKHHKF